MVERNRQDSSRELLEELEDGWGAPPPPAAGTLPLGLTKARPAQPVAASSASASPSSDVADATDEEISSHTQSNPDLDSLDEGWLDDLFPHEGNENEDDDDDEDDEPELPDERLDPEAFAIAKKAREERAAKKREKKRAKAEAKRTRQKARVAAMRQKQKAKKGRAAGARDDAPAAREPRKKKPVPSKPPRGSEPKPTNDVVADTAEDEIERPVVTRSSTKPRAAKRAPSTIASVKLLAIVLAILLALAAAGAAIVK